jgi:hypothetical protein
LVQVRKFPAPVHAKLGGCTPGSASPACQRCGNALRLVLTLPCEKGWVDDEASTGSVLQTYQCPLHSDVVRLALVFETM